MKIEILKFEADWCGPCQKLKPVWVEAQKNYLSYKFTVVDCTDDLAQARKYNVKSVPTFIVLEDGKEVDRVVGANPQGFYDALNRWL